MTERQPGDRGPTPLAADLTAGPKRLKLATVRAVAPEVLQTGTTQRWKPEGVLRTLVEAEIAGGGAANLARQHSH